MLADKVFKIKLSNYWESVLVWQVLNRANHDVYVLNSYFFFHIIHPLRAMAVSFSSRHWLYVSIKGYLS